MISAGPQLNLQPEILPVGAGLSHRTEDQLVADDMTAMDAAAKARINLKAVYSSINSAAAAGSGSGGGSGTGSGGSSSGSGSGSGGGGGGDDSNSHHKNDGTPGPMRTGDTKKKKHLRAAAGKVWEDPTLADWPDSTYRDAMRCDAMRCDAMRCDAVTVMGY